jgi:hypothetical protein
VHSLSHKLLLETQQDGKREQSISFLLIDMPMETVQSQAALSQTIVVVISMVSQTIFNTSRISALMQFGYLQ